MIIAFRYCTFAQMIQEDFQILQALQGVTTLRQVLLGNSKAINR